MDEILLKLDRIERMLYTLLNDEEKEKINDNEAIINNNHYFGLDSQLLTYIRFLEKENKQLKEQIEASEKARKEAIEYLYEHSQYVDEYGIHYIKENEYCVDYLLDILDIDKGE